MDDLRDLRRCVRGTHIDAMIEPRLERGCVIWLVKFMLRFTGDTPGGAHSCSHVFFETDPTCRGYFRVRMTILKNGCTLRDRDVAAGRSYAYCG